MILLGDFHSTVNIQSIPHIFTSEKVKILLQLTELIIWLLLYRKVKLLPWYEVSVMGAL